MGLGITYKVSVTKTVLTEKKLYIEDIKDNDTVDLVIHAGVEPLPDHIEIDLKSSDNAETRMYLVQVNQKPQQLPEEARIHRTESQIKALCEKSGCRLPNQVEIITIQQRKR